MRTWITRFICRSVIVALAIALVGCAPRARARVQVGAPQGVEAPSDDATELKARGDASMDAGEWADAIDAYRASYDLTRDPALLYNIGHAYARLGEYPEALAYLEQFAAVAPADLRARAPRVDGLIAMVRAHLATLSVTCNVSGARILVRGKWRGTTPLVRDLTAAPGDATIEVVADGYAPFKRELRLVEGRSTSLHAALVKR
jgi:tetratricopeptide (TPR) repeat protein